MSTPGHLQKVKNLRRDPRIAICVADGNRYVNLYGTVTISEDQAIVRQDIERLVERYVPDEAARQQTIADDVLSTLEAKDLRDVVVVGHLYSGIVAGMVIDRANRRRGPSMLTIA